MKAQRRWKTRQVLMRCDRCGYEIRRVQRGACPRCKDGLLIHGIARVKWLLPPAPIVIPGDD